MTDLRRPRHPSPTDISWLTAPLPASVTIVYTAASMEQAERIAARTAEAVRRLCAAWLLDDQARRHHAHYARHAGTPRRRNRPGRRKARR